MDRDDRLEINYDELHREYVAQLIEEWWYPRSVAENTDDWRDEFIDKEYSIYQSEK